MTPELKVGLCVAVSLFLAGTAAVAQQRDERANGAMMMRGGAPQHATPQRAAAPKGEPHPGPRSYQRVAEPKGWNARPAAANPSAYQHNYQAARNFKIGPYHPPAGWTARRWAFGQVLPRAYWVSQYILADYWLFGLEVPPVGYEWVRDGDDAILVSTVSGQILQVEYGVFA